MKYVKMLGLLAVAAAAMMAFAATASATTLTSPAGTTYTGTIHASNELGHTILHASNGITVECASTVTGTVTTHGSSVTAGGHISSLVFGTAATEGCTNNDIVHVKQAGTLEIHHVESVGGSGTGTVTSTGATIEVTDNTGVTCGYKTENTHVGSLTTSNQTGGNATLDINSAKIPRHSGSILCGATGTWTGFYKVTTPATLLLDTP